MSGEGVIGANVTIDSAHDSDLGVWSQWLGTNNVLGE